MRVNDTEKSTLLLFVFFVMCIKLKPKAELSEKEIESKNRQDTKTQNHIKVIKLTRVIFFESD